MYRSKSLEGPFTKKTVLYSTPETGGNVFTYNAKAHPQLGDGHTLLITYNVNSFDTNDLYVEVDNYRPRYVAVDMKIKNGQATDVRHRTTDAPWPIDAPRGIRVIRERRGARWIADRARARHHGPRAQPSHA